LVEWKERESLQGPYGKTGEEKVFDAEFEVTRGRYRYIYYIKGYFFEKTELKGVCIQSFRIDRKIDRTTLRIVR
jgi:hypothetical protein